MEFKQMTIDDFNKISKNLENFDNFWSQDTLKDELSNSNTYYIVAHDNDDIIGFGGFSFVLDEYNLNNIVIRKDKRNQKIGYMLLTKLVNYAISNNASFINLEVRIDNLPAIKLYENLGFKKVGIRKHYYHNTIDAILMTLYLT